MTDTATARADVGKPAAATDDPAPDRGPGMPRSIAFVAIPIAMVAAFLGAAWNIEWFREGVDALAPLLPVGLYALVVAALAVSFVHRVRPDWTGPVAQPLSALHARLRPFVVPVALGGSVLAYLASLIENWETGSRRYFTIAGVVPWSDAKGYFGGAERILFDGDLDAFNSLRPLNTAYLAVRLALTGLDLRRALVIQAIVVAIAAALAARAVAKDLGPLAGFALFSAIYGFAAFHVESTMTETLGVTLGCLAFATLWTAVRESDALLAAAGLFLLGVGLAARAGALALLVVLPGWFAWQLRGNRRVNWRAFGLCVSAVVLAISANYVVIFTLGGDPDAVNGNAGYTTYGLAVGIPGWDPARTGWTQSYYDYPEEMARRSLTERLEFVADRARDEIREHPTRYAKAVVRSGQNYAKISQEAVMGSVTSPGWRRVIFAAAALAAAAFLAARWRSSRWWAAADALLVGCALFALPVMVGSWPDTVRRPFWFVPVAFVAMAVAFLAIGSARLRLPAHVGFTLACFGAIIVSTPFLTDGGVRLLATTIPFLAVPLAFAVALVAGAPTPVHRPDDPVRPVASRLRPAGIVGLALVAAILVGGPVAAALVDKPSVDARRCPDGRVAKAFLGGESVRLVDEGADDELGEFAFTRYDPSQLEIAGLIDDARPGSTILGAIDTNGSEYIVVATGVERAPRASVLYVCGVRRRDATTEALREVFGAPLNVFVGRALDE